MADEGTLKKGMVAGRGNAPTRPPEKAHQPQPPQPASPPPSQQDGPSQR